VGDELPFCAVKPAVFEITFSDKDLHAGIFGEDVTDHSLLVQVASRLFVGPEFSPGLGVNDADAVSLLGSLESVEYLQARVVRVYVGDIADVGMAHFEGPEAFAVIVEDGGADDQLIPAVAVNVGRGKPVGPLARRQRTNLSTNLVSEAGWMKRSRSSAKRDRFCSPSGGKGCVRQKSHPKN
jgi:hypothetical protein